MRIASFLLIALGALALGYFQYASAGGVGVAAKSDSLPMLFSGAALTVGLLLLTVSHDVPHSGGTPDLR